MAKLYLYSLRDQEVQEKGGLNWGLSDGHVEPQDAYFALPIKFFNDNPNFFPPHGSCIKVLWDDGIEMKCLLEGTQEVNGVTVPKQISTYNDKSILGTYMRRRLGVSSNQRITRKDLKKYGREDIDVTQIDYDTFKFDFS